MKNHNLNFLELVESSLKNVRECDIHQVKANMDNGEDFLLIFNSPHQRRKDG